jgi:nucleoside-diphosphate-sugar epimerase
MSLLQPGNYFMQTVLITGGSGFLGRYINAFFEQSGARIINIGRSAKAGADTVAADLSKEIPLLPDLTYDIVVHAAGKAHIVPKTEAEKQDFYQVNVQGTKNLLAALEQCSALPKAFVFISTVSVYGLDKGENIQETHSLDATEPYGLSKIQAEYLLQEWGREKGVTISVLRLPLIAGANPPGNLGSMLKGIRSGKYFRIGKANAKKSIVLASDVAKIIPVVAQTGGIYNLTDGYDPSFTELEDAITASLSLPKVKTLPYFVAASAALAGTILERITGKRMPISNRLLGKITSSLTFSSDKARRELGWKPEPVLDHIKEITSWKPTS